jgi:hypothetical protein
VIGVSVLSDPQASVRLDFSRQPKRRLPNALVLAVTWLGPGLEFWSGRHRKCSSHFQLPWLHPSGFALISCFLRNQSLERFSEEDYVSVLEKSVKYDSGRLRALPT